MIVQPQNSNVAHHRKEICAGVFILFVWVVHLLSMMYKEDPATIVSEEQLKALNQNTKWFLISLYSLPVVICYWVALVAQTKFLVMVCKTTEQLLIVLIAFVITRNNFDWGWLQYITFVMTILLTMPFIWMSKHIEGMFKRNNK